MGNCLDRSISDDEDEMPIEQNINQNINESNLYINNNNNNNNHDQIVSSASTIRNVTINNNLNLNNNSTTTNNSTNQFIQLTQQQQSVFYLTPVCNRTADQLTEEEQIKLLKRMALIQQLPSEKYDESKKNKECVICMVEFEVDDKIKYLPCLHTFHQTCIDAWLIRSLICPSCMEPVDAGLLIAFEN